MKHRAKDYPGFHRPRTPRRDSGNPSPQDPRCGQKPPAHNNDDKWPKTPEILPELRASAVLPDGNGGFTPCPELLTEEELIRFLRIQEVSNATNLHNVVEHLKRVRNLPRIHICNKTLYPRKAIQEWVEKETCQE
jgi:hypothetical protein